MGLVGLDPRALTAHLGTARGSQERALFFIVAPPASGQRHEGDGDMMQFNAIRQIIVAPEGETILPPIFGDSFDSDVEDGERRPGP